MTFAFLFDRRCVSGKMFRRWLLLVSLLGAAGSSIASSARGAFEIVSHSAHSDAQQKLVEFQITFDRRPDFFSLDGGNPRHAFQYWYDSRPGGFEFAGDDVAVIRGPEIRLKHAIPVRDSINRTGRDIPGAEGWGAQRGEARPFSLDGAILKFSANWPQLGETDEVFSYRLFAFEAGELTSDVTSPAIVPLAAGWKAGIVALLTCYALVTKSTSSLVRAVRPKSE